jgi:8-oxo-dGTP diphosphatase
MTKEFKNPAATATLIIERENKILFIRRKYEPYKGRLALPGGFLNYQKETLERAAQRELEEETTLRAKQSDLYLLCVHSSPIRDPRDHVIDHVYIVLDSKGEPQAKDDAKEYIWKDISELPKRLAFDHSKAIKKYLDWRLNSNDR